MKNAKMSLRLDPEIKTRLESAYKKLKEKQTGPGWSDEKWGIPWRETWSFGSFVVACANKTAIEILGGKKKKK